MARLTEAMKLHVVRRLACYDSPSQVAESVMEEFGVTVTRQQVNGYNPKAAGSDVSKKLRAEFERVRTAFETDLSDIPVANICYRLNLLQRACVRADLSGNTLLMMKLLEQAAKEVGGMYERRGRRAPAGVDRGEPPEGRPVLRLVPVSEYSLQRPTGTN